MPVIAVLNQKGGSGKTTISTHLARAFQLMGRDVLLVDSDPQGSARDWAASKAEQPVPVIGIDRPVLDRDIPKVAKGLDKKIVIIDGAPQIRNLAASAIKAADLVLIPVQPSPYDIWATSELVDVVRQRIEITEGRLKAAFVVSRAIVGTKVSSEIAGILAGYNLPVLRGVINQRIIFSASAGSGETALDQQPNSQAADECRALASEVLEILEEK